jgi:hypothetical protein
VGSGQFADGALDAVALMHSFFKRLALLLDSTRLQQIVIFSHHNASMSLLRPDALGEERAAMAMSAPLETVRDPMIGAFFEPTALRILKSSRTNRLAPGDVDGERFDSVGFWDVGSPGTGLCRTDQLIVLFESGKSDELALGKRRQRPCPFCGQFRSEPE